MRACKHFTEYMLCISLAVYFFYDGCGVDLHDLLGRLDGHPAPCAQCWHTHSAPLLDMRLMHGGLHARRRYVLITPLVTEGWERAVLVQRGWVPAAWRSDAHLRAQGEPSGQARVHASRELCAKRWEFAADLCLHCVSSVPSACWRRRRASMLCKPGTWGPGRKAQVRKGCCVWRAAR